MFNPIDYVFGECLCPSQVGNCCYAPDDTTMGESIVMPHENDILFGRGGKNNKHVGNERLRQMARDSIFTYKAASKKGKSQISRSIVSAIHNLRPSGRFLKRDFNTGLWVEVDDDTAREKTSQALRDAVSAYNASKSDGNRPNQESGEPTYDSAENDINTSFIPPPPPLSMSTPDSRQVRFPMPAIVSPERSSYDSRKATRPSKDVRIYPRVSPTPDLFNEFIGQIGSDMSDFDLFNGALLKKTDSASSGSLSFVLPREKKMRC